MVLANLLPGFEIEISLLIFQNQKPVLSPNVEFLFYITLDPFQPTLKSYK